MLGLSLIKEKITFFTANHFCCLLINFQTMVSFVQIGKIMWCLLFRVAKLFGDFGPGWQKGVVSFVHPGKNCLVSFDPGVFCPTFVCTCKEVSLLDMIIPHEH